MKMKRSIFLTFLSFEQALGKKQKSNEDKNVTHTVSNMYVTNSGRKVSYFLLNLLPKFQKNLIRINLLYYIFNFFDENFKIMCKPHKSPFYGEKGKKFGEWRCDTKNCFLYCDVDDLKWIGKGWLKMFS